MTEYSPAPMVLWVRMVKARNKRTSGVTLKYYAGLHSINFESKISDQVTAFVRRIPERLFKKISLPKRWPTRYISQLQNLVLNFWGLGM